MKKVTLGVLSTYNDYNQLYQAIDTKFSFCKRIKEDHYEELFTPVLCRDYLSDAVVQSQVGRLPDCEVFGFRLDEEIDTSELMLRVVCSDKKAFLKNVKFIKGLEKKYPKLKKPLQVYETSHADSLVLVGDPLWVKNSLTISLLTFLIRICNTKVINPGTTINTFTKEFIKQYSAYDDSHYASEVIDQLDNFNFLIRHIDEILGDNPLTGVDDEEFLENRYIFETESSSESFHNNSGLLSFAKYVEHFKALADGENDYYGEVKPYGVKWVMNFLRLKKVKKAPTEIDGIPFGGIFKAGGADFKYILCGFLRESDVVIGFSVPSYSGSYYLTSHHFNRGVISKPNSEV